MRARIEKDIGESIENMPELTRLLPPASCSLFTVGFRPPGVEFAWSFRAGICDTSQETRVRQLLLDEQRIRLHRRWSDAQHKRLTLAEFDAVSVGTSLVEIRGALGPPGESLRSGTSGFVLTYYVDQEGVERARSATLTFDAQQNVVKKEIEPPREQ